MQSCHQWIPIDCQPGKLFSPKKLKTWKNEFLSYFECLSSCFDRMWRKWKTGSLEVDALLIWVRSRLDLVFITPGAPVTPADVTGPADVIPPDDVIAPAAGLCFAT